jgi:hypothetical protein
MGIEQKLVVGRFINFNMPNDAPPPIPQDKFVYLPVSKMTIEESTGVFQKQSNIIIDQQNATKVHRNFQWLAWIPGAISAVQLPWGDVLTGPMSGCWLVIYKRNGIKYVGHIGTAENTTSPQSIAAKEAWYKFAPLAGEGNLIAGFNPLKAWTNFPKPQPGDGPPDIFGLVTTSDVSYAVFTFKGDGRTRAVNLRRIADIKQIPRVSPPELLTLFGPPFLV